MDVLKIESSNIQFVNYITNKFHLNLQIFFETHFDVVCVHM
jgi:hypothetical protein